MKLRNAKPCVRFLKRIKVPFLKKYTFYELIYLYIDGLIQGAFGYRTRAISFTLAVAIFPFTLFTLNLIPYIPIENFQLEFIHFIEEILPQSAEIIVGIFSDITENKHFSLLSSSAIVSLLFMSNGIYAILSCFENSYYNQFSRNIIKRFLISILVSLIMSGAVLIIVLLYIYLKILTMNSAFDFDMEKWNAGIEYSMLILLILFLNTLLFVLSIPQRTSKRLFLFGILITTLLMLASTYGLNFYLEYILNFNQIYGSIGFLLTFMIFIWINANILILGFELTHTLQNIEEIEEGNINKN